jgi:hypothetical protein
VRKSMGGVDLQGRVLFAGATGCSRLGSALGTVHRCVPARNFVCDGEAK